MDRNNKITPVIDVTITKEKGQDDLIMDEPMDLADSPVHVECVDQIPLPSSSPPLMTSSNSTLVNPPFMKSDIILGKSVTPSSAQEFPTGVLNDKVDKRGKNGQHLYESDFVATTIEEEDLADNFQTEAKNKSSQVKGLDYHVEDFQRNNSSNISEDVSHKNSRIGHESDDNDIYADLNLPSEKLEASQDKQDEPPPVKNTEGSDDTPGVKSKSKKLRKKQTSSNDSDSDEACKKDHKRKTKKKKFHRRYEDSDGDSEDKKETINDESNSSSVDENRRHKRKTRRSSDISFDEITTKKKDKKKRKVKKKSSDDSEIDSERKSSRKKRISRKRDSSPEESDNKKKLIKKKKPKKSAVDSD